MTTTQQQFESLTSNTDTYTTTTINSNNNLLELKCSGCDKKLSGLFSKQRQFHCHLCGKVFCAQCTSQRALIPPSSIVLSPNRNGGGDDNNGQPTTTTPSVRFDSLTPPQEDAVDDDDDNQDEFISRRTIGSVTSYEEYGTIPINDTDLSMDGEVEDDDKPPPGDNWHEGTMMMGPSTGEERERTTTTEFDNDDLSYSVNDGASFASSSFSYANTVNSTTASMPNSPNISRRTQSSSSYSSDQALLYGHGLEERMKLAREPLRVCQTCHSYLEYLQEELRNTNSNAMKYNSIDPTGLRRLVNSPLAFTLGHEVRKAAYALNNLLPMPKRMGAFQTFGSPSSENEFKQDCNDGCSNFVGNFANVDGVKIPARLLLKAKGVAILTVIKGGMGFAGFEFGSGLVVSRLSDGSWSAPCAIGTAGVSWGALVGLQLSDHVLLLMTDDAVDAISSNDGSVRLGADVGVAVGPLGRTLEADVASGGGVVAPIYTYSLAKGFYVGASFDGKVIITRHHVNEKFYGKRVHSKELLRGDVPTPPAAQPLYDALRRCQVYAKSSLGVSTVGL